jgi:hypothetical protein
MVTHAKFFLARSVFTSSCLVTTSNNGYASASGLKSSLNGGSLPTELFLSLSLILRLTVSRPVRLRIKHPPGAYHQIFIAVRQLWFVDVERCLWREDGSVVYNCRWPLPEQSFSGPSPVELVAIFCCLRFESSPSVASFDSKGYGGGIRRRLHTGWPILASIILLTTPLHGPSIKHYFHQYLYCCRRIRCSRNVYTESLPRNGYGIFAYLAAVA